MGCFRIHKPVDWTSANPKGIPVSQGLSQQQIAVLVSPLNPARITQRRQGSSSLSYLEAWDVKASLIKVFGFAGFSAEALECEIVRIEDNVPKTSGYGENKRTLPIEYDERGQIKFGTANFRVTARVRVKLTIHQTGAVYTEWAASSQTGPDLGEVTDFAIKTAESDGLKRAAIYLGTQFGLSLYNNGDTADVVKRVFAEGQEWPPVQKAVEQSESPAGQTPAPETPQKDGILPFGSGLTRGTARRQSGVAGPGPEDAGRP